MVDLCKDCKASGLPILPVRYTVVPTAVVPALPAWASADRVKSVPLSSDFHYALRTVRAGFVYLFYAKNAWGANQWECYAVTDDGVLVKQPNPAMAKRVPALSCSRQGHSNARLRHLVIERPDDCGPTWIAYSPHPWSDETVKEYTSNPKLRNARMQTIHPAQMAKGAKHSHGAVADAAALQEVLEYAPGFSESLLPYGGPVPAFSAEDGSYKADRLNKMSTTSAWHLRKGEADADVKWMHERAKKPGGHNTAHVLALWDAIGMAHELNGYRNDAAGWLQQYGQEREFQLTAVNAIEGVKKALDRKITEGWDQVAANTSKMPDFEESGLRTRAVMSYAKGDPAALGQPLYQLDEKFKAGQLDEASYKAQRSQLFAAKSTNPQAMEAEYAKIDKHRQELAGARTTNLAKNKQGDIARTWSKYEAKLNQPALKKFKDEWVKLQTQADTIIDRRTEALVKWLEAPLLIDTLEDFHPTSLSDGVLFEDAIGEATFGMGSSKAGVDKIDEWVKQAKASVKTNLLWRAIALNQQEGLAELDAALQEADQHKTKRTIASSLTIEGYLAKTFKSLADTYKKATGIYNANDAATKGTAKAFGAKIAPVNTRNFDKITASFGDRVFRHFRVDGLADHLSEKMIQHLFTVRALVDPGDSMRLIVVQAANETEARGQLLRRMQAAKTLLTEGTAEMKSVQADNLRAAWGTFKAKNSGAANAIKDARLALVVMLIEGVNTQKLIAECLLKNDAKSWWSLAASGLTLSSALYDIASVPAKALFGAESWSYQKMKLYGGLLSGAASAVGVWFDWQSGDKALAKEQRVLAVLYWSKSIAGGGGALLTLATTFTYSAPMIERLTGRVIVGAAVRAVGVRTAAVIGVRILFMSAGAWITVGTFGIQCFIWIITDDKLQDWASLCAFGQKNKAPDAYRSVKQQEDSLTEALVDVGIAA